MKILDRFIKDKATDIVGEIGTTLDNVITSDDERLEAKNKLTDLVTERLTTIAGFQRDALVEELRGSWLQRSWRPIVMLAFAAIVVYNNFIAPAFHLPNAILQDQFWNLLEIGIGGYVIGRSVEKVTDKVTQNVDISFIKRKNRKQ